MTKEEAINILKTRSCYKCFWDCDNPLNCHVIGGCDLKEATKAAIESLEQPKWIPVTDRLPKENGRYIVTNSALGMVDWNIWVNGEWLYPNGTVVAWMPLPSPYAKDGE